MFTVTQEKGITEGHGLPKISLQHYSNPSGVKDIHYLSDHSVIFSQQIILRAPKRYATTKPPNP